MLRMWSVETSGGGGTRRCFSFIFESQSLHSACLLRGECGQMGNDQMHARQRMPLEVKGDRCQAHGSWGSLRTRAGSECSGEGRRPGTGLSRARGASMGLFNIQHVDSQKSMLILKLGCPEPPSLLASRVGVKYLSIYKHLCLQW